MGGDEAWVEMIAAEAAQAGGAGALQSYEDGSAGQRVGSAQVARSRSYQTLTASAHTLSPLIYTPATRPRKARSRLLNERVPMATGPRIPVTPV